LFLPAFFAAAQRFLALSAMRLRAAGLIRFTAGLPVRLIELPLPDGRLEQSFGWPNASLICCSREAIARNDLHLLAGIIESSINE
jgi:hypothetical protein